MGSRSPFVPVGGSGKLSTIAVASGLVLAVASACSDPSHVFQGRLFVTDANRECLGTTSSVDVVEGDLPGTCPAACLVQSHADGGRSLYVSTMCAPFPFMFDASSTDPVCPAALAALVRNDTCLVDGGSANPPSPPPVDDAGVADAATD
jgi:hypothetical protein